MIKQISTSQFKLTCFIQKNGLQNKTKIMTISLLEWKDGKTFHYEHPSFLVKQNQTITTIIAVEGRETISL